MSIWSKRNLRFTKKICIVLIFLMVYQAIHPITAWALTSGPTQPEVQTFQPVGSTQMVDLFSGDFSYNIPLLEVPGPNGGYPINLFYNSVTDAETEASMVGLGWNIGIGAVTTNVRGIPDAFSGDKIENKVSMKPNWTIGLGGSIGSNSIEIFGADLSKVLNLGFGRSYMYNSYKGLGYSIDPNIGFKIPMGKMSSSFGLNMSINSLEGASMNASINLDSAKDDEEKNSERGRLTGGMSFGMNGRGATSMTIDGSLGVHKKSGKYKSFSVGGTYNFATPTYVPSISQSYRGTNMSLNVRIGGDVIGTDFTVGTTGFLRVQKMKKKNKWVSTPAYGFMHLEKAYDNKKSLMDFNREKDGVINEDMPNLYIPIATPDILSVSGHGTGGSFLTQRSDNGGLLLDPEQSYSIPGGQLGVELAGGTGIKVGVDGSLSNSRTSNKRAATQIGDYQFHSSEMGSDFEPFYLKSSSDMAADLNWQANSTKIGGDEPIKLAIDNTEYFSESDINQAAQNSTAPLSKKLGKRFEGFYELEDLQGNVINTLTPNPNTNDGKLTERKTKTSPIVTVTNKMLQSNTSAILPEYNVSYYSAQQNATLNQSTYNSLTSLSRNNEKPNLIGGYTSLTADGARYVYGLPVKNQVQYDVSYSYDGEIQPCDKTVGINASTGNDFEGYEIPHQNGQENYLNIKKLPAYPYSHLLTSVLGSDYVDKTQDGITDDDYGYWMKVEYVKTSDNFIWKTPFEGANAIRGLSSSISDDKAAFTTGKREQFYPAKIVTKVTKQSLSMNKDKMDELLLL